MPVDDFKVTITNLKSKYNSNTKTKIKVRGRELFPIKDFADTFNYSDIKYLPQASYYQLEDYLTEEIIFPFGNTFLFNLKLKGILSMKLFGSNTV